MSTIIIDMAVRPDCWNHYDSYGEICVRCGCCTLEKNRVQRLKNRLAVLRDQLSEQEHFDAWSDDPEIRALQQRNNKANIAYFKRKVRYYEKRVKEMEGEG